ncbi:hypothetical protein [Leptolyngbya sp. NIES-2104]|uniref:hypothetical protein n=1 Tax=Leptolyngbya sp. NIES-2104 TaxID=1552121 RepID=UPI00178C8AA4|nr:hypothetical protein [Leptolyngbya sp. NIES-2104]
MTQSAKKPNQIKKKTVKRWAAGVVAAESVSKARRRSQFPQGTWRIKRSSGGQSDEDLYLLR